MKKALLLILIIAAMLVPVSASSQYISISASGGYTSTTDSAVIGAGMNYGYLSDVSRFVGIGF